MTILSTKTALLSLYLSISNTQADASIVERRSEPAVECLLVQVEEYCPTEDCAPLENEGWFCMDDLGSVYAISGLSDNFFRGNRRNMVSATTMLSVWPATKKKGRGGRQKNEIVVGPGAMVSLQARQNGGGPGNGNGNQNGNQNGSGNRNGRSGIGRSLKGGSRRRNLNRLEGNPTVLVIYVTSSDSQPTYDFDTVVNDVLGTSGDTANLVTQYAACSGGKLNFVPAENPSDGVTGGAVAVNIPNATNGVLRYTVEEMVNDHIAKNGHGWLAEFDHIMYVLPAGADWGAGILAYAYVNTKRSVYNDKSASYVATQVHEIGHNLFMAHSGAGGSTYRDHTCYMGNALAGSPELNKNAPLSCFNALKSWHTGWYSAGHEEVTSAGWSGRLVGVDDFNRGLINLGQGDRMLLKIPHPTDIYEDLYVMYNRAKGVNAGVTEAQDRVVLVKGPLDPMIYAASSRVAVLDPSSPETSTFLSTDHGYDGSRLLVQVHATAQLDVGTQDYATVSVVYDASPTAAPTSCMVGSFEIELKTDNFPTETSWEVREDVTGNLVAVGSGYAVPFEIYTHRYCLETNGPFVFTITDSFGDGICCDEGTGYYNLVFNGELVHSGGDFRRTESFTLYDDPPRMDVISESSPPSNPPSRFASSVPTISQSPTVSPSNIPTSSPSASPSHPPSGGPTSMASFTPTNSKSPSTRPTQSFSVSPSNPPSTSPSERPTSFPSITPTDVPSRYPTEKPSGHPSLAPTRQPSAHPSLEPSSQPSLTPSASPATGSSFDPNAAYCDALTKHPCRGETICQWQLGTCWSIASPDFETICPGKNFRGCGKEKSCVWDNSTGGCIDLTT